MQPLREMYACGVPVLNEADERWLHLTLLSGSRPRLLLNSESVDLMWGHLTHKLPPGPPEQMKTGGSFPHWKRWRPADKGLTGRGGLAKW